MHKPYKPVQAGIGLRLPWTRINFDQETKYPANKVQVKLLTWYPITMPKLPGLTPTTDSEFIVL